MNAKDIRDVVKSAFKALGELVTQIAVHFDEEAIHDFRVTVKKLRAFLRLLNAVENKDDKLKLTGRFKALYSDLGSIRNLHMLEDEVYKLAVDDSNLLPVKYLRAIKIDVEERKLKVAAMSLKDVVENEKDYLLHALPNKLTDHTLKRFLKQKWDAILELIVIGHLSDEQLHDIRKALKDILYNWKYIEEYATEILPGTLSNEENIKVLTDKLGKLQDISTIIYMFQTSYRDGSAYEEEHLIIEAITGKILIEKAGLKQTLLQELKLFLPTGLAAEKVG
jgi:CHAD domain-containing protein